VRRLGAVEHAHFDHVPAIDGERARIVVVPWLTPGVAGMTLGRWVLLRRGHEHDGGLLDHRAAYEAIPEEQEARALTAR